MYSHALAVRWRWRVAWGLWLVKPPRFKGPALCNSEPACVLWHIMLDTLCRRHIISCDHIHNTNNISLYGLTRHLIFRSLIMSWTLICSYQQWWIHQWVKYIHVWVPDTPDWLHLSQYWIKQIIISGFRIVSYTEVWAGIIPTVGP